MAKLILSFKGRPLSSYPCDDRPVGIGRDPDCDIVIDSLAVAPRHAVIAPHPDGYGIVALSADYPLVLNGEKVARASLHDGDLIRIGKHSLQFRDSAQVSALRVDQAPVRTAWETEPELAYVQMCSGPDLGRIFPLRQDQLRLTQAGAELAVISRRPHGYVLACENQAVEIDVNGMPVQPWTEVPLADAAEIQLGALRCRFFCRSWRPPQAPGMA